MTISEILNEAARILSGSSIDESRREALSLLEYAIQKNRTFIFAHPECRLSVKEEKRYRSFIERRANREPFHYIVGHKEFYGLDFVVTPDVLIPRPETEMLVRHSIEILGEIEEPVFCEVGVGSGCIAVSVLCKVESAAAVGLEISEKAIAVAANNSVNHNVADRLILRSSNIYSGLTNEKFDLIVANPPYIPAADLAGLQAEVRDFEPHLALTDGSEGLSIIETIIHGAHVFLKPGGFLLIEIGIGQAAAVNQMFDVKLWRAVEVVSDFQAIPRMVRGRLN